MRKQKKIDFMQRSWWNSLKLSDSEGIELKEDYYVICGEKYNIDNIKPIRMFGCNVRWMKWFDVTDTNYKNLHQKCCKILQKLKHWNYT